MRKPIWLVLAVAFAALIPTAASQTTAASIPPPVRTTVERSMDFLKREAYSWKESRGCAACHHAATLIWSYNEARARGYTIDETSYKEINAWMFEWNRDNIRVPQPPPRDVINLGAVYALLAAETAPGPMETPTPEQRHALVEHIVKEQEADGAWGRPLDERVPFGGPVEDIAILSRSALLLNDDPATTATLCAQKASDWLAGHHDEGSRHARNLRLFMAILEKKSAEELKPVVDIIKAEQNADGGWSQTPEMASDAYATGQSLYVLARAGVPITDEALARGVAFLCATQKEDGSWPMISRVNSKNISPITCAGAAWATLGLVRASP